MQINERWRTPDAKGHIRERQISRYKEQSLDERPMTRPNELHFASKGQKIIIDLLVGVLVSSGDRGGTYQDDHAGALRILGVFHFRVLCETLQCDSPWKYWSENRYCLVGR